MPKMLVGELLFGGLQPRLLCGLSMVYLSGFGLVSCFLRAWCWVVLLLTVLFSFVLQLLL
jgi:hypothetical protein